jgi:very-short-patch-repair endonuclease
VLRCDGRFVAKLDFAWPGMRVGVEYDGLHHAGGRFLRVDRARMNRLLDAGWLVLTLTASDLADSESFDRFCAQLRRAIDNRSPRIAHV